MGVRPPLTDLNAYKQSLAQRFCQTHPDPFRQAADRPFPPLQQHTHRAYNLVTLTHSVESQCGGLWATSKVSLNSQLDSCISAHGTSLQPLQESIILPVTH